MQIQNPDVASALRDSAKLTLAEVGNLSVGSNVSGVIDLSPLNQPVNIIGTSARSATGSSTLLSSDATADYIITGIYMTASSDASCDITEFWVGGTINGVASTRICSFQKNTLTAFTNSIFVPFEKPLLLKTGTTIAINMTFTVGSASFKAIAYGYKRTV